MTLLVLDLDDTLLRSDKTVSGRNLEAIRRWRAAGNTFVIATGRPPRNVAQVLPEELLDVPRIVYNGAHLVEDGEVVYRNLINPADVRAVLEWTQHAAPHWYVGLEIDDVLYLNRALEKPGHFEVADLHALSDRPAAKILFIFPGERDDLEPLLTALPATMRALVTPKFKIVQLCGHTTDKADALAVLLERQGRTFDDVVAIGDDVNDIEMVHRAGIGIAVENALPEVKAAADWITCSNNDDGVACAIDRLLDDKRFPMVNGG